MPLLLTATGANPRRGFGLGFVFGIGFFGALLIWISIVGYIAWALAVLIEACFTGAFGALWAWLSRYQNVAARIVLAAAAWVSVEYVRAIFPFGGFTWGQLAQSQHDLFYWTLRPAAWGGAWLVAGILVGINAAVAEALVAKAWPRRFTAAASALALLGVPLLLPMSEADGPVLRVAIVQGNVPQDFSGSFYDKELAITRSHAELTRRLDGDLLDLVIWPESAVGLDLQRDPTVAREVVEAARAVQTPMIIGGNVDIDTERYRVVAFHIAEDGEIVDIYRKTHLVPFGEYVPGRDLLDWVPMLDQVPRDAVPGSEPNVFELAGADVATVISFEGDFGPLVRRRIEAGARLLVVATNTSTWGHSWASAQHVAFSQVRAAENAVPVAHAALSGISAFIDPHGRVLESSDLYEATTMSRPLTVADRTTFYTRAGEWFAYLSLGATGLGVAFMFRRHFRRER